jgi:hypothetical protein
VTFQPAATGTTPANWPTQNASWLITTTPTQLPNTSPATTCNPGPNSIAQTCVGKNATGQIQFVVTVINYNAVFSNTGNPFVIPANASDYSTAMLKDGLHEIGHQMGLGDEHDLNADSVENQFYKPNDTGNAVASTIQPCDHSNILIEQTFYPPPPPQTQAPPPTPPICSMGGPASSCAGSSCIPPSCPQGTWWEPCDCEYWGSNPTPIIIDTDGSGFQLTSAAGGIFWDFYGNGHPLQISWTAKGSTNGWLALDRNGNGVIHSAKELFGNITDQPASSNPNGYLALAVFDEPGNGGNGDGVIDNRDAIWPKLVVWIDSNHDGISQPNELHSLDSLGIHSIDLVYKTVGRTDQYGNQFRYKGTLNPDNGGDVNRTIYDVILVQLVQSAAAELRTPVVPIW